jgi:hypothetical protein
LIFVIDLQIERSPDSDMLGIVIDAPELKIADCETGASAGAPLHSSGRFDAQIATDVPRR